MCGHSTRPPAHIACHWVERTGPGPRHLPRSSVHKALLYHCCGLLAASRHLHKAEQDNARWVDPAICCEDFLTSVDVYFPLLQHSGLSQYYGGERSCLPCGQVCKPRCPCCRWVHAAPSALRAKPGQAARQGGCHQQEACKRGKTFTNSLSGEKDWVGLRRAIKLFRKDINGLRFCSFFFFLSKCILLLTYISSEKN